MTKSALARVLTIQTFPSTQGGMGLVLRAWTSEKEQPSMENTMKTGVLRFGLLSACLTYTCSAEHMGWYLKAGVGPAWTEEVDVKSFLGPTGGATARFDPGFRFDIGGGYRFCDWFSAELETGMIYNSIGRAGPIRDLGDSSLANVPIMANALLEIPTGTPFVPFVGAGAGVSFSVLTLDEVGGVDGTESDAVFAYQAIVGTRYNLNDKWSINVTYKYFATGDPSWDVRGSGSGIEVQGARTHAIMAGFNYNF